MMTEAVAPTLARADHATSAENRDAQNSPKRVSKIYALLCELGNEFGADEYIGKEGRFDVGFGKWLLTFHKVGDDLWISISRYGRLEAMIIPRGTWIAGGDEGREQIHDIVIELLDVARRGGFERRSLT